MTLTAGTLLTAGCSTDKETTEDLGRVPVNLSCVTVQATDTRAANDLNETQLTSGNVKVNMKKHSEAWDAANALDYTAGAGGTLTAVADKFFYDNDGSTVDIIAYYPSTAGTSFSVLADQSADDNYKGSDLMWAEPVVNQSRTTAAVTLKMNHKMAKISVKATAGVGSGISKITSIKLLNIKPEVSFNQITGAVGAASGTPITITAADNSEGVSQTDFHAVVFPAQEIDGNFIEITADGQTAIYKVNEKTFMAGHQYSITVDVISSALNTSNTIISWDDSDAAIAGVASVTNPLVIGAISAQAYTGTEVTLPSISVTCNGLDVSSSNYDVYYANNVDPGKATVYIAGKEGTTYEGMYGARDFKIEAPSITSSLINSSHVGWIVASNGKVYPNRSVLIDDVAIGVAMIAYVGENAGDADVGYRGLAIALNDANNGNKVDFCSQNGVYCLDASSRMTSDPPNVYETYPAVLSYKNGIASTTKYISGVAGHTHAAATAITTYRSSVTHPTGTSDWFMPSAGQWNLLSKGMLSKVAGYVVADLSYDDNLSLCADNYAGLLLAAGGSVLNGGYWASTEYNNYLIHYGTSGGRYGYNYKYHSTYFATPTDYVRLVFAF